MVDGYVVRVPNRGKKKERNKEREREKEKERKREREKRKENKIRNKKYFPPTSSFLPLPYSFLYLPGKTIQDFGECVNEVLTFFADNDPRSILILFLALSLSLSLPLPLSISFLFPFQTPSKTSPPKKTVEKVASQPAKVSENEDGDILWLEMNFLLLLLLHVMIKIMLVMLLGWRIVVLFCFSLIIRFCFMMWGKIHQVFVLFVMFCFILYILFHFSPSIFFFS